MLQLAAYMLNVFVFQIYQYLFVIRYFCCKDFFSEKFLVRWSSFDSHRKILLFIFILYSLHFVCKKVIQNTSINCKHGDQKSCDANANCVEVIGGHRCVCKMGYQGDGTSCKKVCPILWPNPFGTSWEDEHNGFCYSFRFSPASFLDAEKACAVDGALLTSTVNKAENELKQALKEKPDINPASQKIMEASTTKSAYAQLKVEDRLRMYGIKLSDSKDLKRLELNSQ